MTDEEAVEAAKAAQSPMNTPDSAGSGDAIEGLLKMMQLDGLANHPATKISLTLMKDPAFKAAASEIYQKFDKVTFYGYEIGWIILIWILRAWRLSKASTVLTRLWVQAWVALVFWAGLAFMVPWLLWGKSYQTAVASVFRAVIHQFWA